MTLKRLLLIFSATCVVLGQTAWGQRTSNWRVYRVADGFPEPACSSVTIASPGRVLVRHPNQTNATELDGYKANAIKLPSMGSSRVYQTPSGQFWTSIPGSLLECKGSEWTLHPLAGFSFMKPADPEFPNNVVPLFPVKQGLVLFLHLDQLVEFSSENPDEPKIRVRRVAAQTRLGQFFGMAAARDGGLWIGGKHGLAKIPGPTRSLKPEVEWQEFCMPDSLPIHNLQEPHEDAEGGITAVAESTLNGQKVLVYYDGKQWRIMAAGTENIRQGWRGADKTFWAITPNALLQWDEAMAKMVENEEISARKYFDAAVEPDGIFWLATSEGLFRYTPHTWQSLRGEWDVNALIHGLTEDGTGRLWFVAGNRLHVLKNEIHTEYVFPGQFEHSLQSVRGLYKLKNDQLILDTENELIAYQTGPGTFNSILSGDQAVKRKIIGSFKDGNLCFQRHDTNFSPGYVLEKFDGARFEPLSELPETSLGKNISAFFVAQNGDLWLSGEEGTACYHEQKWRTYIARETGQPKAALSFIEMADGGIWCAAQDRVWMFDGRSWLRLRRDFDRINSMLRARDGTVWVASNSGLHRYTKWGWMENGVEEGLPSSDVREVCEDQRGRIWAGSIRGLSLYYPEADADAPLTHIQVLSERGKEVMEGKTINFAFRGQDKWKYTPRERLLYSYRLDQNEWSDFGESTMLSLADLPAGKHYFRVRAMDRNGNVEPKPARLEFAVILPWYKESRLVTISFFGLAGALFFAAWLGTGTGDWCAVTRRWEKS